MTTEEIIRLVFSFLGGGLVTGILSWIKSSKGERTARKVDHLNNQIRNLYGPLCFFVLQNESFFKLNEEFHNAYTNEYSNKQWSQNNLTQERLKENISQTINVANQYMKLVRANNEKVMDILVKNYAYIDPDDIDIFQQFVVHYSRLKTEQDETGKTITPLEIYRQIGDISFMRPEFIRRVKEQFHSKKTEWETFSS
jgi:hypothetical protein